MGLRALRLPPRLYRHLQFRGPFSVTIPGSGRRFLMEHFGYEIENEVFWRGLYGNWEGESMRLWVALCARAHAIVDIGANTGIYALVARAVNGAAPVIAFEPVPRVFDKLRRNIDLNGYDIDALDLAVSDHTGEAVYFDQLTEHTYSVTLNRNMHPEMETRECRVRTVSLDDFIASRALDRVDLLKIDVELHEAEVLEGFRRGLDAHRPDMLIEVIDGDVAARVDAILRGRDYVYFAVNERGGVRRIPRVVHDPTLQVRNVLVCSASTAGALRLPS